MPIMVQVPFPPVHDQALHATNPCRGQQRQHGPQRFVDPFGKQVTDAGEIRRGKNGVGVAVHECLVRHSRARVVQQFMRVLVCCFLQPQDHLQGFFGIFRRRPSMHFGDFARRNVGFDHKIHHAQIKRGFVKGTVDVEKTGVAGGEVNVFRFRVLVRGVQRFFQKGQHHAPQFGIPDKQEPFVAEAPGQQFIPRSKAPVTSFVVRGIDVVIFFYFGSFFRVPAGFQAGGGGVGGRGCCGGDHIFLVKQQWRGGVGGGGGGQKKEAEGEVGELHFFRRVHHVAVGPEEKRCGVVDRDRDGENNEREQ